MTQSTIARPTPGQLTTTPARRRLRRAATITAALVAAVLDWIFCTRVLGLELIVDQGAGPQPVLLPFVALAPIASGLTGWALLALLERFLGHRGRTAWRVIAVCVMVLSCWSPLFMAQSTSTALSLVSMHLLVGLVLITGLAGPRHRS